MTANDISSLQQRVFDLERKLQEQEIKYEKEIGNIRKQLAEKEESERIQREIDKKEQQDREKALIERMEALSMNQENSIAILTANTQTIHAVVEQNSRDMQQTTLNLEVEHNSPNESSDESFTESSPTSAESASQDIGQQKLFTAIKGVLEVVQLSTERSAEQAEETLKSFSQTKKALEDISRALKRKSKAGMTPQKDSCAETNPLSPTNSATSPSYSPTTSSFSKDDDASYGSAKGSRRGVPHLSISGRTSVRNSSDRYSAHGGSDADDNGSNHDGGRKKKKKKL